MDEDPRLLEGWRGGDGAAGERLWPRYFGEIYRFFEHKIPPASDPLSSSLRDPEVDRDPEVERNPEQEA